MSSVRPVASCTSIRVNGSSRAPNRDVVRRTPLATALSRPVPFVSSVTIRSASPSFWVRSTIASSRYKLTDSFSARPEPGARDALAVSPVLYRGRSGAVDGPSPGGNRATAPIIGQPPAPPAGSRQGDCPTINDSSHHPGGPVGERSASSPRDTRASQAGASALVDGIADHLSRP